MFGSWVLNSWSTIRQDSKLGIIDFCCIPGVHNRSTASIGKPYFEKFLKLISLYGKPMLTNLLMWLFVCGDDDVYLQVKAFSQKSLLDEAFNLYPSEYIPAPFEDILQRASLQLVICISSILSTMRWSILSV